MVRIEDAPKDCIRTHSGIYINVFEPTPEMICVEDMAHALSQQPRFAGHLPRFYSVAQHSVLCMRLATLYKKMAALLHDGSEAYILDIPTPIKNRMPEYKKVEDTLMGVIAKKFEFDYPLNQEVKDIDRQMLHTEWDNIVANHNPNFICWSQAEAKEKFIKAYYDLKSELSVAFL